ncbi:Nuclear RNA export factor 2, partial [Camelus dromedarius]
SIWHKYEEKWLLNLIQKHCSVPFTPVEVREDVEANERKGFPYKKMQAQFFVENAKHCLCSEECQWQDCTDNNERVCVKGTWEQEGRAGAWSCLIPRSAVRKVEQIKILSLDLSNKRLCQLGGQSDAIQNASDIKNLNVSSSEGSFFGSDELKSLILQFLQQILDPRLWRPTGSPGCLSRRGLLSLTIPFNPEDPAPSSLWEYVKDSRNMKKLKDPYLRVQLLKKQSDIVRSLCLLPKTQHDLSFSCVDMWLHTTRCSASLSTGVQGSLLFVVEVEGRSQGSVRAFTQTFIAIPASPSSLCIVNDELFVRDASPKQREMVCTFSTHSGMNLQWSQK